MLDTADATRFDDAIIDEHYLAFTQTRAGPEALADVATCERVTE